MSWAIHNSAVALLLLTTLLNRKHEPRIIYPQVELAIDRKIEIQMEKFLILHSARSGFYATGF